MTFGCSPTASVDLLPGNCRSPCLPCFHGTAQLLWASLLPPRHAGLRAAVQEPAVLSDGTIPVSPAMPGSWNCNLPCLQCIVIADTGCAVTCNFILSCSPLTPLPTCQAVALVRGTVGRKCAQHPVKCTLLFITRFLLLHWRQEPGKGQSCPSKAPTIPHTLCPVPLCLEPLMQLLPLFGCNFNKPRCGKRITCSANLC